MCAMRERERSKQPTRFFFSSARGVKERERESNTTIPQTTRSSGTQSNSIANEEEHEEEEQEEYTLFQSKRSRRKKSTEYIKKESEQNAPDSDSSPLGSSSLSLSVFVYTKMTRKDEKRQIT